MDRNTFDDFTRAIGSTSTRRRFGGILVALGLSSGAAVGLLGADEADAKNKKKRRKARKRRRKNREGGEGDGGTVPPPPPPPPPPTCIPDCNGPFGVKECGDDGCGGTCGTCTFPKPICQSVTFTCGAIVP